jgi:ATP-dependent Clp protease ATP-binding subunit ClpA
MSSRKNYKVVAEDLNLVLFVKGFKLDDERKLYDSIRKKIETAESPVSIESYKEFLVRKFLVDADAFMETMPEDAEDQKEIVESAYDAIIGIYPPFALDFICQDLNTDTFFTGIDKKFLKHLKDQVMATNEGSYPTISLSSMEDICDLRTFLEDNIVGQRQAVDAIVKALKLMASGLARHSSFLFVGPTGVGKTQLAKLLGQKFSGNFYKINCAEYAGAHEYAKLIGSPPGYVGHTDKSLLAEKAEESNRWVFLFDEIEKGHHKLYDFLLSLLDDGTCTDNMGTVLDFSESIFIFTSNQGVNDVKRNMVGFDRTDTVENKASSEVIHGAVKRHFTAEFLNRLDDIVQFDTLSKSEVREIASLQLDEVPIKKTNALIDFVADEGYSQEYGARNIARFIKNNVSIKVADAILNKQVPKGSEEYYTPRLVKGNLTIINTKKYQTSST